MSSQKVPETQGVLGSNNKKEVAKSSFPVKS